MYRVEEIFFFLQNEGEVATGGKEKKKRTKKGGVNILLKILRN